jgi:hypothetical protein
LSSFASYIFLLFLYPTTCSSHTIWLQFIYNWDNNLWFVGRAKKMTSTWSRGSYPLWFWILRCTHKWHSPWLWL